jgi:4-amino-4-deoxy-L-arabinose transferase-like glycosyltransferase
VTSTTSVPKDRQTKGTERRRRRLPLLALIAVSIGYLALGLSEAWTDAPTFDEPVYVSAGVVGVLHHDLTINEEHPPLPKILAALPVLLVHPVIPRNGTWSGNDERSYSARFLAAQRRAGSLRRVTFASRLVPLIETVGLAWLLFGLASSLFGSTAGALAGILWLASPFVLGIGHLDGTDIPFALAVATSSWALLRWLRARSVRRLAVVGLTAALVASCQISGVTIVLATLVVIVVASRDRGFARAASRVALVCAIALVGLWVPYLLLDPGLLAHGLTALPKPYLAGFRYLDTHDTVAAPGYLLGTTYTGGRWWFWPVSLAGALSWWWTPSPVRRQAVAVLLLPAVALAVSIVPTPRDIGLRYLLPVMALWCVGASAIVPVLARRPRATRRVLGAALVAVTAFGVGSAAASFPDSVAWTSLLFRPAYATVTNSDVDWGQGLYQLEAWGKGRHPWVAYFGPRGVPSTAFRGGRSLLGTAPDLVTGWVAVSATALTDSDSVQLSWLRKYCPVSTLAGSILIYRFPKAPSDQPASGRPPPICSGPTSLLIGRP